jgi:hypothetical protein
MKSSIRIFYFILFYFLYQMSRKQNDFKYDVKIVLFMMSYMEQNGTP